MGIPCVLVAVCSTESPVDPPGILLVVGDGDGRSHFALLLGQALDKLIPPAGEPRDVRQVLQLLDSPHECHMGGRLQPPPEAGLVGLAATSPVRSPDGVGHPLVGFQFGELLANLRQESKALPHEILHVVVRWTSPVLTGKALAAYVVGQANVLLKQFSIAQGRTHGETSRPFPLGKGMLMGASQPDTRSPLATVGKFSAAGRPVVTEPKPPFSGGSMPFRAASRCPATTSDEKTRLWGGLARGDEPERSHWGMSCYAITLPMGDVLGRSLRSDR